MEIKIGVQYAVREIVVDSDEAADKLEKKITDAVTKGEGVLSLTDRKGRKVLVPASKIAYVEIGGGTVGTVGFKN